MLFCPGDTADGRKKQQPKKREENSSIPRFGSRFYSNVIVIDTVLRQMALSLPAFMQKHSGSYSVALGTVSFSFPFPPPPPPHTHSGISAPASSSRETPSRRASLTNEKGQEKKGEKKGEKKKKGGGGGGADRKEGWIET